MSNFVTSTNDIDRLIPELQFLRGNIKSEVRQLFVNTVPDYFWIVRASESHHPPDERGLCGLWLHTKRVFTSYLMLESTFATQYLDEYERNCARAAVLLHDAFKYGQKPFSVGSYDDASPPYHPYLSDEFKSLPRYTAPSHDVQTAQLVRDETDCPEEVARAIESHGGSQDWFGHNGPSPTTPAQKLVHYADVFASNEWHRLPVYKPAEELVRATDSEIPAVYDDEYGSW